MGNVGFDCIVDAGLGRTAADFDRYRVTVFDHARPIDTHFATMTDEPADDRIVDGRAYQELEAEIGRCGAAEIAGASVAAPYVSAIAATVAIARAIALASGCPCPSSEVRRISSTAPRPAARPIAFDARGVMHAGRPVG